MDGQPPINVRGSDGAPLVTANGPVQVCRDGNVLMTDASGADAPASTASYTSTPTYEPGPTTPERPAPVQKRVDPYGGDVLLSAKKPAPTNDPVQENPGLFTQVSEVRHPEDAAARPLDDTQTLSSRLDVPRSTKVKAARLGDRNMILPKGRTIECGLSVRLVSDLAGQASCVLTQNVYSDNGRVVLLERGSEAVGEYRATLEHGQRRLFVIWTRIKTPTGVIIDLNSPAADGLGAAGLPGHVDHHWWQRVGSAFLLSTVQDAIVYAASRNPGGDTIVFQNTQSAGRQMADRVLEQSINIRPTLYKTQGDRGLIYVARDLDFGDVYALRPR
ncbi:type IV secretion system protein VirB10 [Asticcacaulis sp. YBE204]|uniref:type IV secretion system protein VirB10 n=1 Tax=Asticcacaulis sp. YBE204 TaxID=1282363 RepID=UPI00138AE91B|nr:type IV secretion system protein VirB10 [Asticcacaulis sp. YBE204]